MWIYYRDFIKEKINNFDSMSEIEIEYADLNKKIRYENGIFIPKKVTINDIIEKIESLRGCGTIDIVIKDKKIKGEIEGYKNMIKIIKNILKEDAEYCILDTVYRFPINIRGVQHTYRPSRNLTNMIKDTKICLEINESFGYNNKKQLKN